MAQAVSAAPTRVGDLDGGAMLVEMLDALGSELDLEGVVHASAQLVGAVFGWQLHAFRLALPDASGDLRAVAGIDESRRRCLVRGGEGGLRPHDDQPSPGARRREGQALTIPFVSDGLAYGVVDIVAPADVIDGRRDALDAVAGRIAVALSDVSAPSSIERGRPEMHQATAIVARVAQSSTREGGSCVRSCEGSIRGSVSGPRRGSWKEASRSSCPRGGWDRVVGIDCGSSCSPVEAISRPASRRRSRPPRPRTRPTSSMPGALSSSSTPTTIRGSARRSASSRDLRGLLRCLFSMEQLRRRDTSLDDALTMTAHELRGPMLAAKATMDGMLQEPGRAADDGHGFGSASNRGAGQRRRPTAPVAVSDERLRRRSSDLVGLVQKAIDSVVRETGEDRVILEVSLDPVSVPISRRHLSFAVGNLIRNAIASRRAIPWLASASCSTPRRRRSASTTRHRRASGGRRFDLPAVRPGPARTGRAGRERSRPVRRAAGGRLARWPGMGRVGRDGNGSTSRCRCGGPQTMEGGDMEA